MSNTYSLLNFIAATSKDIHDTSFGGPDGYDSGTFHSLETELRELSEDEKRLTGISTISVVTRLALEFDVEAVCNSETQDSSHISITCYIGYQTDDLNASSTFTLRRAYC